MCGCIGIDMHSVLLYVAHIFVCPHCLCRSDQDVSTYDLGFDAGQMFTFKTHSTSVMALRCQDIPVEHRSKARFCHILMIIPGPKEPDNVSINYFDNRTLAIVYLL